MGWCLYSLILVFIHLFELFFPPAAHQSNSHWTCRLGFRIFFFLSALSFFLWGFWSLPCSSLFPVCVCGRQQRGAVPRFLWSEREWCCHRWSSRLISQWLSCLGFREFGKAGFLWLICFWSFVIKSFHPSCLLVWMLNYCSSREWHKLEFVLNIHVEIRNR